ncbi:ABC transporter permease [Sphingomonas arenae]|uniref:ABC transporter permease n=1 Tax=Sphingomonas arenae TaxID=2812555 RepID=UPI001968215D|nr:ABC transporter permease [Sphingomonas arenae]
MSSFRQGQVAPRSENIADRLYDHVHVILALAKREVQSRFGQHAIGYAWTYVTPLAWIAVTYVGFMIFGRSSPVYTDTVTFIISGLIPYVAFRSVINGVGRVNSGLRGLVIFPSVTHAHGTISAALVEYVNVGIVFVIVAGLNLLVFGDWELDRPLHFLAGVSLAWALGLSYGYLFSVLAQSFSGAYPLSQTLLRPTFFISGVFFTGNELPDRVLDVLALNPLLHAVEIARDGMLFHYQSRVASAFYPLAWIAGLLLAATVVRSLQRR